MLLVFWQEFNKLLFFRRIMYLIHKSALVIVKDNKLLVVRKRGTKEWLMPGGKPMGRESAAVALRREIKEELDCEIEVGSITQIGDFEDYTADRKARVAIKLFLGKIVGTPKPSSEIEELIWISLKDVGNSKVTPIIKNEIMPFLVESGILVDANV